MNYANQNWLARGCQYKGVGGGGAVCEHYFGFCASKCVERVGVRAQRGVCVARKGRVECYNLAI